MDKQLKIGEDTGLFAKQQGKVSHGIIIGADAHIPFA